MFDEHLTTRSPDPPASVPSTPDLIALQALTLPSTESSPAPTPAPVKPIVSVVIPAFNEEKRLERGIRPLLDVLKARGEPFEIIVVDDGSKDGTVEVANRLQRHHPEIKLEQLGVNRGKGAAVRHGALKASGTYILLADADGATEASDLEKLRARIDDGADVAIGSRRLA